MRHNPAGKLTVACSTTAAPPAFHANLSRIASAFSPCCEFVTSSLCVTTPPTGNSPPDAVLIAKLIVLGTAHCNTYPVIGVPPRFRVVATTVVNEGSVTSGLVQLNETSTPSLENATKVVAAGEEPAAFIGGGGAAGAPMPIRSPRGSTDAAGVGADVGAGARACCAASGLAHAASSSSVQRGSCAGASR